jgi:hypothetical protein
MAVADASKISSTGMRRPEVGIGKKFERFEGLR